MVKYRAGGTAFGLPSLRMTFPALMLVIRYVSWRPREKTRYMEQCGVNGKTYESESTLKNILSKYDTLDGNRLSLQGFISYYRDIAASEPRQVSAACALTYAAMEEVGRSLAGD